MTINDAARVAEDRAECREILRSANPSYGGRHWRRWTKTVWSNSENNYRSTELVSYFWWETPCYTLSASLPLASTRSFQYGDQRKTPDSPAVNHELGHRWTSPKRRAATAAVCDKIANSRYCAVRHQYTLHLQHSLWRRVLPPDWLAALVAVTSRISQFAHYEI